MSSLELRPKNFSEAIYLTEEEAASELTRRENILNKVCIYTSLVPRLSHNCASVNVHTGNDIHAQCPAVNKPQSSSKHTCVKARTGEGMNGVEEAGDTDTSSNLSTLSKASSNYSKVSEPGKQLSSNTKEWRVGDEERGGGG